MSIYLGIPCHDGRLDKGHLESLLTYKSPHLRAVNVMSQSMLTKNFNTLFAHALNERKKGITHFAMLHSDVVPEKMWLDKLYKLMNEHQADVISAIVPIKSEHGLTSTGFDEAIDGVEDWYYRPKRLTMTEAYKEFEPTFTNEKLLVNTGCMLIDIRKAWVEKIWFEFEDKIVEKEPGYFVPICVPEDWNFSRRARAMGAKLFATREVLTWHMGGGAFSNSQAWGSLEHDEVLTWGSVTARNQAMPGTR